MTSLLLVFGLLSAQEPLDSQLTAIAKQCWEQRAAAVARIRTPGEVAERQVYIRQKVLDALGGFPAQKTPLNPRITGTLERDGYRVEKLIYESLPRFYVTANLYVPTTGSPPYPAVLGASGHSANGKAMEAYQRVWISLAKRGFVVLAWDPPGQGERYEYFDAERGKPRFGSTAEHTMAGVQCLLTGSNFARYELWDAVRGLDYLLTRAEVDPKRIGVAGNSGGGTQTAYLQVVEPRLAVAAPSCYITSWEKLWAGQGPQDAEQNFVGFLKDGLDFADFLIAFAPRPLKVLTAIRDFFPIEGARASFAEARRMYEILGTEDRIEFFEYDDPHGWSKPRREATYAWLERWLRPSRPGGPELDFPIEPDANLNCTPTGQVSTSLKGETVQSLNQALAEQLHAARRPRNIQGSAKLRALVAARVGVPGRSLTRTARKGGKSPAVLYLDPDGKGAEIEALSKAGYVVVAPDVHTSGYRTSMRALLVGRSVLGIRVGEALAAFDSLAARTDVDPSRISVLGKGNGGVLALYVGAFEPRIQKVACEGAVLSYLDVARAKLHQNTIDIVVPGVLRDFDLPDLARLVAPRSLWIVDARTPAGAGIPATEAAKQYPRAKNLRFLDRPASRSFEQVYAEWMK
jgi:cephalosporin-C deacetylase-like acetyl esterase